MASDKTTSQPFPRVGASFLFQNGMTSLDLGVSNGLMSEQNKRGGLNTQAYCVKCKAKKEMKDAKSITMKNGKPATQGVCPSCGTKMFRIGNS
jgi:hypothetical protein